MLEALYLMMMMCDPCSGHSTRDQNMVDGCSYGGQMFVDYRHDGHGHVGAPDDGPLMEIVWSVASLIMMQPLVMVEPLGPVDAHGDGSYDG